MAVMSAMQTLVKIASTQTKLDLLASSGKHPIKRLANWGILVKNQSETPYKTRENTALEIESRILREQIDALAVERNRERDQLSDQIADLRKRLDGAEAERTRLNALLMDQRTMTEKPPSRRKWRFW